MEREYQICTITVLNRDASYKKVAEILHQYAERINLRVGYPLPGKNIAVIFLVIELNNDEVGAFSGKLGQLPFVKIKTNQIKM